MPTWGSWVSNNPVKFDGSSSYRPSVSDVTCSLSSRVGGAAYDNSQLYAGGDVVGALSAASSAVAPSSSLSRDLGGLANIVSGTVDVLGGAVAVGSGVVDGPFGVVLGGAGIVSGLASIKSGIDSLSGVPAVLGATQNTVQEFSGSASSDSVGIQQILANIISISGSVSGLNDQFTALDLSQLQQALIALEGAAADIVDLGGAWSTRAKYEAYVSGDNPLFWVYTSDTFVDPPSFGKSFPSSTISSMEPGDTVDDWLGRDATIPGWQVSSTTPGSGYRIAADTTYPSVFWICRVTDEMMDRIQHYLYTPSSGLPQRSVLGDQNQLMALLPVQWATGS